MTNHPAGSATGIDLAALEQLAHRVKAVAAIKSFDDVEPCAEAWGAFRTACEPDTVLALIALARATPQHSVTTTYSREQVQQWRDDVAHAAADMVHRAAPAFGAGDWSWLVDAIRGLAKNPQHSVTEHASVPDEWLLAQREPSQEQLNYAAYNMNRKRNGPDMVTAEFLRECWSNLLHSRPTFKSSAQPLASTAATQPEQASIETWENRYNAMPGGLSDSDVRKCMEAEIADLRAALAIPASTAAPVGVAVEWQNGSIDFVRGNPNQAALNHWKQYGAIARPLVYASTAATQPEQASEFPPLPEMESLADIEYAQRTPDDWDADYRATWQKLQVAERNKMQWRAYALQIRAALAIPASTAASEQPTICVSSCFYGDCPPCVAAGLRPGAASEQQAGADERVLFDALNTIADLSSHIDIGIVETINELANAALTHRATTAPAIPTDDMCRVAREKFGIGANYADHIYRTMVAAAPGIATTAADQQGDTLPRWIDDLKGSDPTIDGLIEYIIAQQGAAQAQVCDKERLDWIEQNHTLHNGVEFLYVVNGYQAQHTYDGNAIGEPSHGATLRGAIDAALNQKRGEK